MPVNAERRLRFHGFLHAPAAAKTRASAVVGLMDREARHALGSRGVGAGERGRVECAHGVCGRREHDDGVEFGQALQRAGQEIAAREAIEIAEGGDEAADAAVRGGRGQRFAQACAQDGARLAWAIDAAAKAGGRSVAESSRRRRPSWRHLRGAYHRERAEELCQPRKRDEAVTLTNMAAAGEAFAAKRQRNPTQHRNSPADEPGYAV